METFYNLRLADFMNIKMLIAVMCVLMALCFVPPVHGQQNTFTTTTLAVAVSAPGTTGLQTCFTVASGTGINAPTFGNGPFGGGQGSVGSALFVDNELMQVTSISGANVCVARGQAGTRAAPHASGQLVWIGGDPTWFSGAPVGTHPQGTCTVASLVTQPDIHYLDGTIWNCDSGSVWGFAGLTPGAYGAPVARTTVNDAAYTAKVWDSIIAYTALSATRAVTLPPATSMNGKIYTVIDESGAAGTDAITITASSGTVHCTSVAVNYSSVQCRSNGTGWYDF
jgi:hypothetical protein